MLTLELLGRIGMLTWNPVFPTCKCLQRPSHRKECDCLECLEPNTDLLTERYKSIRYKGKNNI